MSNPDRTKAPSMRPFTSVRLDFPKPIRLANGIETYVAGNGEDEVCRISWYLPGGKFQEAVPMQATLTAMSLFEGCSGMTAQQVADTFDSYGAMKSAQAFDNVTLAELSSLNKFLPRVLPAWVRCVTSPAFSEAEVDVKRQYVASSIASMQQKVKYLASCEMNRLYYGPGHPLARVSTPAQVEAIDTGMLRGFHAANYSLAGSRIVVSGHITSAELEAIDSAIGSLPLGPQRGLPREWPIEPSATMQSVIDRPGAMQSAIAMTIRAVNRSHPDYLKLRLLVMVLGGYFGSRLMTNIREDKDYTYGIGAVLSGRYDDAYVGIITECACEYTASVIAEVKKEIGRLRSEPIGLDELSTVKRHLMSDLVKTLDTPFSIADYVGSTFLYGVYPEYFNRQVKEVHEATPDELRRLAVKYLDPAKLRIVVAGDKSKM